MSNTEDFAGTGYLPPDDFKLTPAQARRIAEADVIRNIGEWRAGRAKLDVRALYAYASERFGDGSPTNWVAHAIWELQEHAFLGHTVER